MYRVRQVDKNRFECYSTMVGHRCSWPSEHNIIIKFQTSLISLFSVFVSVQLGRKSNCATTTKTDVVSRVWFSSVHFLLFICLSVYRFLFLYIYMQVSKSSNSTDKFKQHARLKTNTGNNHCVDLNKWFFTFISKLHHI
jgi:hypothetical protein